jgi:hypothetical protein
MALYHFNIHHDGTIHDLDGMELPDKDSAWKEATKVAGEAISNIDGRLKPGHDWRMEVTDEFANPIWELHVKAEKR